MYVNLPLHYFLEFKILKKLLITELNIMQFIFPGFLWALFAILIPVIIHLFYFRRFKKVYFSNTRFLKEIKEETSNTNKLKNLLILLSRILAIVFLVFAFAQPYIPQGEKIKQGMAGISIYFDNSFSMQANSNETSLLEKGKKIATEIINAFPENSNFQIITNDLHGEEMRWIDKKNALEKINHISLSPVKTGIKNISNRQIQSFSSNPTANRYSYWISDFQANAYNIDSIPTDTSINYNLILLKSVNEKNISIDSCYWDKPLIINNYVNKLLVKISNLSDDNIEELPVNILYNGENLPMGKINIKPNSSTIDTLEIRIKNTGWNEAKVFFKDYPIVFDDDYYMSFNVPEKVSVLNINNLNIPNSYFKSLYENNEFFSFQHSNISNVDYLKLSDYQLVILEDIGNISSGLADALKIAMNNGTNVVFFPATEIDKISVNRFLNIINANSLGEFQNNELQAVKLNENEYTLQNVFDKIPKNIQPITVKGYYEISKLSNRNGYNIIELKNGNSLLSRYKIGNGNFYLFSSPLNEKFNDLGKNPDVFVPLFFKLSIANVNSEKLAYTIGVDKLIKIPGMNISSDEYLKISENNIEFIPQQKILQSEITLDIKIPEYII